MFSSSRYPPSNIPWLLPYFIHCVTAEARVVLIDTYRRSRYTHARKKTRYRSGHVTSRTRKRCNVSITPLYILSGYAASNLLRYNPRVFFFFFFSYLVHVLDSTNNPSIRPGLDLRRPATYTGSTQELAHEPGRPKQLTPKVNSHYNKYRLFNAY